jgi:hypothetical protein
VEATDATDPVRAAAAVREPVRLQAVAALGDLAADPWCDGLVASARDRIGAPVALVSIVGRHQQRFPGASGLPEPWQRRRGTPLTHSFCQYVVGSGRPLVVADARRHPVLHDNQAIGDLGTVAYAGAPIVTATGQILGSFCVIDVRPRLWTGAELRTVVAYADTCGRRLSRPVPPHRAEPPVRPAPPAPDAEPARRPDPTGPPALWNAAAAVPGLLLDARRPLRTRRDEMVFTGRYHAEAVTLKVRVADSPQARRRFARRIEAYLAFGPVPPPVVNGAYRWSDHDRLLVLRGGPGTLLRTHEPAGGALTPAQMRSAIAAAVQLSTWQPDPPDAAAWQVDYPGAIEERRRSGRCTDDDARRLHDLLQQCGSLRSFAHGNLTPSRLKQLPSGRVTLVGFDRAGMYLPGMDLATLYLALSRDDHTGRRRIMHRVTDVDVLEPFAVNLFLAVAAVSPAGPGQAGSDRWAAYWSARGHAHRLLHDLTRG